MLRANQPIVPRTGEDGESFLVDEESDMHGAYTQVVRRARQTFVRGITWTWEGFGTLNAVPVLGLDLLAAQRHDDGMLTNAISSDEGFWWVT